MASDAVPDMQITGHVPSGKGRNEADDTEGRGGMEGASLPGVRGDVPVGPEGSDRSLRRTFGGTVRVDDPADEWFRAYAKRKSLSLAKFQRDSGILTRHQEADIRRREVPLSEG